jgi:hypothetical protein
MIKNGYEEGIMPKPSQKTGEANFRTTVFQEFLGTRKFAYMQELDRNEIILPCISPLLMVYWAMFTQGEVWIP